ncbi:trypsin [Longimycelium tulufanense]|uniref:Trypsin n=1 Tax=Longimycelium tulufanense TaxID=907463 RepID=A0A8J3FSP9_9PSEU|nr:serine protease [Longimycelium tulufanense]GGM38235.1 trypsin [Longimycelium tulufanense]
MRGMASLFSRFAVLLIGLFVAVGGVLATPATASERTEADPFIVGGGTVNENLPWISALHRNGRFTCTSTIIAPRWVLTAAHCVGGGSGYSVRVGSLNRSSGGQVANVSRVIRHPRYDWPTADIALLQLDRNVNTTYSKLANRADLRDGQAVTLYGWGSEKADWSGPLPQLLKYARGNITKVSCTDVSANPRVICTRTNGSVAGGDSGGPAVVRNASGEVVQAGVCAVGHRPAGSGWAGYTNVALFRDWIRSHAGV